MRNACWAVLLPLAILAGCGSPVDVASDVPLGAKLPDKEVRGLLRTGVGAGSYESGLVPFPWIEGHKSCQLLTDTNGVVIAKGYQAEATFDLVPFTLLMNKTRAVLEVRVPADWYLEPPGWAVDRHYCVPNDDWPKIRQEVQASSSQRQRELLQQWQDWYEGKAVPVPFEHKQTSVPPRSEAQGGDTPTTVAVPLPIQKNVLDYLLLVTFQLQSVPAGLGGNATSDAAAGQLQGAIWSLLRSSIADSFRQPSDMKHLLDEGATWQGQTLDGGSVRLQNLGDRKFQIVVEGSEAKPGVVMVTPYVLSAIVTLTPEFFAVCFRPPYQWTPPPQDAVTSQPAK